MSGEGLRFQMQLMTITTTATKFQEKQLVGVFDTTVYNLKNNLKKSYE